MTVLETDRLALKHFTLEDAAFALRLLNEPAFLEHIGDKGVRTLVQACDYLREGPIKSYRQHGHGLYRVDLKADGTTIGMCGLLKRDQLQHPDIGYAFLSDHWSKGYAFEAAAAVVEGGRQALGFDKLLALISPANTASIRLIEKLGFGFAGPMKLSPGADEVSLYERAW